MTGLHTRLEVIEADITTLQLDAIVNAANSALMPGGGVDGAIRRKAGREMDEDLYRIGTCAEGGAVITHGYGLPSSRVIHTVAPIWAGGINNPQQEAALARCYDSVLALADTHRLRTIAFPAIGTGAYGWPADIAAKLALERVTAHLAACAIQTRIIFCCFSRADRERYTNLIASLKDQS
jgi:O-acetyl-ADP-ribose deacetylase (regulator of RNase III)